MGSLKIKSIYHFNKIEIEYISEKYHVTKIVAVCFLGKSKFTLDEKGSVSISGESPYGVFDKEQWKNISKISCGSNHIVGLKNDGTAVAYGDNSNGQCNVSHWKDVAMISTSGNLTVGITESGVVLKTNKSFEIFLEKQFVRYHSMLLENQKELAQCRDMLSEAKKQINAMNEQSETILKSNQTLMNKYAHLKNYTSILQNIMGGVYEKGTVPNYDEALKWYRHADEGGNPKAKESLLRLQSKIKSEQAEKQHKEKAGRMKNLIGCGSYHAAALKSNGTVVAYGKNAKGICDVRNWRNIVAISANGGYMLGHITAGLRADGTVVCVGNVSYSEVAGWKNIVYISAGFDNLLGIKSDGTVISAGSSYQGKGNVSGWKNIVEVSAGWEHTIGLKADGTVIAVGNSKCYSGASDWKNIISVSAGNGHTVGLKSYGSVVAAGKVEYFKEISLWKNIIAVSAGYYHTVGLKADGTVVATGHNNYGECNLSGWKDIVAVSAGEECTLGLKSDGTLVFAGKNRNGVLGITREKLF